MIWAVFLASLALQLAILQLVPGRQRPWHPAQTTADPSVARVRALLLALWARCLLIGVFGCVLAYVAASLPAAWPFVAAAAVLLVFHAPRHPLFEPAPTS